MSLKDILKYLKNTYKADTLYDLKMTSIRKILSPDEQLSSIIIPLNNKLKKKHNKDTFTITNIELIES